MKVREIYNAKWLSLFGAEAMVLYPFMFFRAEAVDMTTYIHEHTHFFQIRRDGAFKFYFKYLYDYLRRLIKYRNHFEAYWHIPYEVEARHQAEHLRRMP